jgi:hypothetical protein
MKEGDHLEVLHVDGMIYQSTNHTGQCGLDLSGENNHEDDFSGSDNDFLGFYDE